MKAGTQHSLEGRRDAREGITAAVGEPGLIGGEVDVEAVENPEALQVIFTLTPAGQVTVPSFSSTSSRV